MRADFLHRKMEADKLVKASEYALRNAKERRIAQVDCVIRPAFRAVKFLMPKTASRLEKSRNEMLRIAAFQETKALKKEAMDKMYSTWKGEYIERPLAELKDKAQAAGHDQAKELLSRVVVSEERKPGAVGILLEHGQAKYNFKPDEKESYYAKIKTQTGEEKTVWGVDLNRAIQESKVQTGEKVHLENIGKQTVMIDAPIRNEKGRIIAYEKKESIRNTWEVSKEADRAANLEKEIKQFIRGLVELQRNRPEEAKHIDQWKGREQELVSLVIQKAKGENIELPKEVFDATAKAGKIGSMLDKEENAKAFIIPKGFENEAPDLQKISSRLEALGIKTPFTKDAFANAAPAEIRKAIDQFKETGITENGNDWTFKAGQIRAMSLEVEKGIGKDIDVTNQLTDKLIQRKQA